MRVVIHNYMRARDAEEKREDVAIRANGKVHPAWLYSGERGGKPYKHLTALCSCPGSQRGTLVNKASVIGSGHQLCNCGNFGPRK
jgi:hypothetical protein